MSDNEQDLLVFGSRLRHARRTRGLTLDALGALVNKPAPFLSQLETGKREPRVSLLKALADALGTTPGELLQADAPTRRSTLEITLERIQDEPTYRALGLPYIKASAKVGDDVLEHLVTLYRHLLRRSETLTASPEGARQANAELRHEMRKRENYFPDIEALAHQSLDGIGWSGGSALSERTLLDLAHRFGFSIRRVRDLPLHTRSVTDLHHRVVYIAQRNAISTREARSVILQTLGHFALGHEDPTDFADNLRQRVEANYFAAAILAPESAVVPFLLNAKTRRDLSVEDIKEVFYISYEMAAHRFTNLATKHLGLHVHFLRSDAEGIIWKAYENDGLPFPTDTSGVIEGQRACRHWGARSAFDSEDTFDMHYQFTETNVGTYWSGTYVEVDSNRNDAITVGVAEHDARYFRGHQTSHRTRSACPDNSCCRTPTGGISQRWSGYAWPSSREHSHVIAARSIGAFPGVDLTEVYEFLDRRTPTIAADQT
jgi:XRE family transcriptional regulator, fatty acid utilization regulator